MSKPEVKYGVVRIDFNSFRDRVEVGVFDDNPYISRGWSVPISVEQWESICADVAKKIAAERKIS